MTAGRTTVTFLCCVASLVAPVGSAFAAVRTVGAKARIAQTYITKETVDGPTLKCHKWGFMEVQLNVTQTETVTGSKKSVSIKITGVSTPISPNHTPRSIYINNQALPLLNQEVLQLGPSAGTNLVNISGASNSTVSYLQSLQGALAKAEIPAK